MMHSQKVVTSAEAGIQGLNDLEHAEIRLCNTDNVMAHAFSGMTKNVFLDFIEFDKDGYGTKEKMDASDFDMLHNRIFGGHMAAGRVK